MLKNAGLKLVYVGVESKHADVLKNINRFGKIKVLGAGSNTLIRDGGFDGAIIKLGKSFSHISLFDKNTSQPTNNYVAVCHLKSTVCDPVNPHLFDDNYPTYLVRYSRFGLITKYKWNDKTSDWSSQ